MNSDKFTLNAAKQVTGYDGMLGEMDVTIEADALPEELVRTPFEIKAGKLKNPMAVELFETTPELGGGIVVKFKYVAHSESPQWEDDNRVDTTTTLTFKGACNDIDLKLKVKGKEKAWETFGKEHDFLFARISAANTTLDGLLEKDAKAVLGTPGLGKITFGNEVLFNKDKKEE
jgi:hypothetical protein